MDTLQQGAAPMALADVPMTPDGTIDFRRLAVGLLEGCVNAAMEMTVEEIGQLLPRGGPAVVPAGNLLAAALDIALHGGVAAHVDLLVAEPHVDPRCRVALLATVPVVVVELGVDRLPVGREQVAFRLAPHGGSGERSSILAYLRIVGSETPTALAIDAIGSTHLALLLTFSILSTPIIPLWPSLRRKPK